MNRALRSVPFVVASLWLSGSAALAADAAVVAVGKCDDASGFAARTFRSALSQRTTVLPEADTAQPFGGTSDKTLASVNSAISTARSDFYSDKAAEAKTVLQGALNDVVRLAPSDTRWSAERDALTLMAQIQQKTDKTAADAALNRILRVEPEYKPDTGLYPPSFQKYFAAVKKAARKRPTVRFEVNTSPGGKTVYVGGRPVGKAPVALRVPAGEYRVEADWGHRGAVRTVTVPSAPIELSAAVDGAVWPDAGPCVEAADPVPALARVARVTNVNRVYGVHSEGTDPDAFVVVTSSNASASDVREARVKLQPGAPSSEALGLLADAAAGGTVAGAVEVTRGPGARPAASGVTSGAATGAAAGAVVAGSATGAPVPVVDTPAVSAEPDPNGTKFEAAVRVGFGLPLGSTAGGDNEKPVSDFSSFVIPIGIDIGVRLGGHWFLGGYFQYGFGGSTSSDICLNGASCSSSTLRLGGQVHWHPLGNAALDPWIGIGSGYESLKLNISGSGGSGDLTLSGWEFVNIQVGLDFAIGSAFKIGPWASFSLGQYSSLSGSVNGSGDFGDISNKAIHEYVMVGVRLVILP